MTRVRRCRRDLVGSLGEGLSVDTALARRAPTSHKRQHRKSNYELMSIHASGGRAGVDEHGL